MTVQFVARRFGAFALLATAGLGLLLVTQADGADRYWTGNAGLWSVAGNWSNNLVPVAGDNLWFFPTGGLGIFATNDFASGTMFGQIHLSGSRFAAPVISGSPITLAGGISLLNAIGLGATVGCNITLENDQTFSTTRLLNLTGNVDLSGHQLSVDTSFTVTFSGSVGNSIADEPQYVIKTNTGTMVISSSAQFSSAADVSVSEGSLVLDGVANGFVYGGNVSGTGMANYLEVGSGGTISPGDNGPGVLSCNNLNLQGGLSFFTFPGGTLQMAINGTTPGTNYGQLVVYSNYFLTYLYAAASAELNVQLGYAAQIGDSFLIVKQVSGVPYEFVTNGIFYGLPSNSIYDTTNGYSLAVLYDTNGISLTTVRTPASPFVLWKGSGPPDLSAYGDRFWSLTNNWAQGLAPGSGSNVVFSASQFDNGLPIPPLTNDLPMGTSLASLLFTDANYVLSGNALTITGGITNQAGSGTNSVMLGLVTVGPLTLDVDTGGTLLLGGSFNGSGTLHKEDGGTLRYTGTTMNSFVGTFVVDSGTFQVDGSLTDGSFTVNGGLLDGTGSVSSVTMNGGTLKPGDSPGVLVVQGNLMMTNGAVFQVELNGPIPGSGYDQLQVNGTVNLNGATLQLQPGFAATTGTAFLILVNDLTDPVVGTFAGLPEGAVFQAEGQAFSISYKAGSGGNDVLVTRVNTPVSFSGITQLNAGTVQLHGAGGSNVTYTIQANTNLSTTNWLNIGTAPADGTGVFLFNDTNLQSFHQRFFRAVSP
jgi:hypothetical protein